MPEWQLCPPRKLQAACVSLEALGIEGLWGSPVSRIAKVHGISVSLWGLLLTYHFPVVGNPPCLPASPGWAAVLSCTSLLSVRHGAPLMNSNMSSWMIQWKSLCLLATVYLLLESSIHWLLLINHLHTSPNKNS